MEVYKLCKSLGRSDDVNIVMNLTLTHGRYKVAWMKCETKTKCSVTEFLTLVALCLSVH